MVKTSSLPSPQAAEVFLPCTLERVHPCPARSDYVEVCFTTPEGPFQWCFPEPPRLPAEPGGPLALTLGPYGVQAHELRDGELGPALPSSTALPMILGGAKVRIARKLVPAAP